MVKIKEFSEEYWSKSSIVDALNLLNPTRHKAQKIRYGYKYSGHKIVPHLKEQQVIKQMIKLHINGLSFRKITQELINQNIKTKKGGKWDKSIVATIISIVDSWSTINELVHSGYAAGFLPDFINYKNSSLINLNNAFKLNKISYEIVCFSRNSFNSLVSTEAFLDLFK